MRFGTRRLHLFILLFAASSLLFQFPPDAFAATPSDITATDSEADDENGGTFAMLEGASDVATFTIGSSTYAIVASDTDDGVQIIDISDPTDIAATDSMTDTGSLELNGARGVDVFTIGSSTYAIVTGYHDNGVQIIDISDPAAIVATDSMDNGDAGTMLKGATDVATFVIGSSTYAIVAAETQGNLGGVQIIDISDVDTLVAKDNLKHADPPKLKGARGVDVFTIGSSTYAIVASNLSDSVQVLDISDVDNIVTKDNLNKDEPAELNGARDVATFVIGSSTYAIVASRDDNGVQIIDISDVDTLVAKGSMDDTDGSLMLDNARGVDVFTIDSSTYAIVAGYGDDGVQIIDISDVDNIVAVDAETDGVNGFTVLDAAGDVETFTIDSSTYAIAVSTADDGVQIIELNTVTASDTSTADDGGSSMCARLVILGNCGTIAINNDEYQIIDPWSTVPTTEVMVGEPVSITLSTPHNYVAGKINSASVYTEIFGSAANYEESTHIYYTVNGDHYVSDHATEKQLFQVAGATHRIAQDTDVKNMKLFEVVRRGVDVERSWAGQGRKKIGIRLVPAVTYGQRIDDLHTCRFAVNDQLVGWAEGRKHFVHRHVFPEIAKVITGERLAVRPVMTGTQVQREDLVVLDIDVLQDVGLQDHVRVIAHQPGITVDRHHTGLFAPCHEDIDFTTVTAGLPTE